MKHSIMIGISLFTFLFIFLSTTHADSNQLYEVDSESVELRDAPEQNASVLTELKNKEEVTVFQESSGWGRTFYQGEEAWVALHQLTEEDGTQTEQSNTEQQNTDDQTSASSEQKIASDKLLEDGKLYQVTTPAIRLRKAPDTDATTITELENGDDVNIFQESSGWGKTFYHDEEAWIALHLLDEMAAADNEEPEENEKADGEQNPEETEKEESEEESDRNDDEEASETESDPKDDGKKEAAAETKNKKTNDEDQSKQDEEQPLSGYHFVIDPGHGGKDNGAAYSDVYEKELTLSTAKKAEEQLRDNGASVTLTRADDTFIPLDERVDMSDSSDVDAFISLHYNSAEDQSASGINTFYYDGDENQALADSMQKSVTDHVNPDDLGTEQADYQVLRDNQQLAVLMELGFISNQEERELVESGSYQKKAAEGIVTGLKDYFND